MPDDRYDANESSGPLGACDQVEVDRALLDRPAVSIRTRVALVFVLLFVLTAAMTVAAVVLVSQLREKQQFLENVGDYAFEIDQARRFEKDYFLYGTNLADALAHIRTAHRLLEKNEPNLEAVTGPAMWSGMKETAAMYENALARLLDTRELSGLERGREQHRIEADLRTYGAQAIADAHELIDRERLTIARLLQTSAVVAISAQIVMLFVLTSLAIVIIRAFLDPLSRFQAYAGRIGNGDYTPITPTRRFRDEFSDLAITFNKMMCELKGRQDQLIQSGKMVAVGTLTAGIAHELNNPINNIGLNVETLLEDFDDYSDTEKKRMLEQIYTQVERAGATVRDLLDFTRKGTPAFSAVSVAEIIESTLKLITNELNISGIDLQLELEDELPYISGSPRNLQQVFLNLFLNSIQAMPDGGVLAVRAEREDEFIRIDVADDGTGIAPENIDKLFDPFFTTKEVGEGTGLGLSVCYGIIEGHKGSINIDSEVGTGTTVTVRLPVNQNPPEKEPE
jgi:two-component system NtrC family sensor kinase